MAEAGRSGAAELRSAKELRTGRAPTVLTVPGITAPGPLPSQAGPARLGGPLGTSPGREEGWQGVP